MPFWSCGALHWTLYLYFIHKLYVYALIHHNQIEQKIHDRVKTRERNDFLSSFMTTFLKISNIKKGSRWSHSLLFMVLRIKFLKFNYTLNHLKITVINPFYISITNIIIVSTEKFHFYSPHKTLEKKQCFIIFKNSEWVLAL